MIDGHTFPSIYNVMAWREWTIYQGLTPYITFDGTHPGARIPDRMKGIDRISSGFSDDFVSNVRFNGFLNRIEFKASLLINKAHREYDIVLPGECIVAIFSKSKGIDGKPVGGNIDSYSPCNAYKTKAKKWCNLKIIKGGLD